MLNFPLTVVDNFFENPDKIVDFALSCDYKKHEPGDWPGKRSEALHELNPELFNLCGSKLISLFYPNFDLTWHMASMFQVVDNSYSDGWVHRDENLITGIVYLNKNENLKSGTSIYRIKKDKVFAKPMHFDKKRENYKNLEGNVDKYREENNSQYEETINVSNVYNRLICFDSHLLHAAQNFSDNIEPRLTLVMFVNSISNLNTPIKRLRSV